MQTSASTKANDVYRISLYNKSGCRSELGFDLNGNRYLVIVCLVGIATGGV